MTWTATYMQDQFNVCLRNMKLSNPRLWCPVQWTKQTSGAKLGHFHNGLIYCPESGCLEWRVTRLLAVSFHLLTVPPIGLQIAQIFSYSTVVRSPGGILGYKRDGGSDVFFWVKNFQLLYFLG